MAKKKVEVEVVKDETLEQFYEDKAVVVEEPKVEVKVESKVDGKTFTTRHGTIRTDR